MKKLMSNILAVSIITALVVTTPPIMGGGPPPNTPKPSLTVSTVNRCIVDTDAYYENKAAITQNMQQYNDARLAFQQWNVVSTARNNSFYQNVEDFDLKYFQKASQEYEEADASVKIYRKKMDMLEANHNTLAIENVQVYAKISKHCLHTAISNTVFKATCKKHPSNIWCNSFTNLSK